VVHVLPRPPSRGSRSLAAGASSSPPTRLAVTHRRGSQPPASSSAHWVSPPSPFPLSLAGIPLHLSVLVTKPPPHATRYRRCPMGIATSIPAASARRDPTAPAAAYWCEVEDNLTNAWDPHGNEENLDGLSWAAT
jgi:hypothetical protein